MLPKNRPPTHPGEMLLEEFLRPLRLSQKAFADHLGWTTTRLNEIVRGKRGVSADSALSLGDALGTGPEFWLNLQRDWDLWHSLRTHRKVEFLAALRDSGKIQWSGGKPQGAKGLTIKGEPSSQTVIDDRR